MTKITKNLAAKLFFILCFIFTTKGTAATIYFNQIYKATGTTYGIESNSLNNLQLVSGYSFKVISEIPGATSFSGNNIRVILNYVNSSGNEVTMYGIISRRIKSGSTTLGVNFVVTDSTWITPTGEAYFLVVPGNEASFSNGSNAGTSSDPIDTTLNNLLSFQATAPIINSSVSSVSVLENAGYAVFTFSLSNPATSNYSFTPYLTAVTATSGTDYTNSIEYFNGSTWASASGGATFTPSNTSFQLRVPIINYNTSLTDKTFNINTGVITGGGILNNYGSYGVGTILVPVITTSGSLTSFSTCTGFASSEQSFTVSGVNLVADLVVTPPAGYEVSTTSGSGFSNSVSLTPASNSVATTTIYVRLSTVAANNADGNIVCSSTSAVSKNVATVASSVSPTSVAGSISGATSVCSGTNSTTLTLNGSTGDVTKWQSSSDNFVSDTNDVVNTTSTLTAENLTATTYYRAVVKSGSCAAENTPSVTIMVINSNIWNGSVSTYWNTADNWNCGVPASGANIEIPGGLSNYPELDSSRTIGNIILASGATLNLNNYNLNVSGTFTGTGTLIGSNTSSLTINGSGNQGTFYMDQTTPGTTNVLANLTLNSTTSGSITLGNALDISGILTLTNGTFNTGNNLTLKSDSTGTAVVAPITDCLNVAITGDVTVERFFPAKRAFRFISSPVTTTTTIRENWQEGVNNSPPAYSENLNPEPGYGTHITGNIIGTNGFDATQTTNNSMFTYNNTTLSWVSVPNTNALTLTAGVPYRLLIRGDRSINMNTNSPSPTNTTLRTKGALKICEAAAGTLSQNANGFSFIGNPYQATVDIKEVLDSSTNLNPNYYWVWDPKVNTRGSYVAYDLTSRLNPVLGSFVNEFLQPWQACFVKTSSAGVASITFQESNKATSVVNENVFRSNSSLASYIRLTLYESNALSVNGAAADGVVVKFGDNFTNAIDENDATKFSNQDENFSTKNNTTLLGIESRLFPLATDIVPLNISQYRFTTYTIVASGTNMTGLTAYLHDQLLQTYTEITQSGSVNYSYVINTSDATTSASDRFRIVFQNPTLNMENTAEESFTMYPNPSKNGIFDVAINGVTEDTKLTIYNAVGQEVYATNLTQTSVNNIKPNKVFARGIYYVKIKKETATIVKKLIIE